MRENRSQAMARRLSKKARFFAGYCCLFLLFASSAEAAELPLVRIAHGAFNEKVEALWTGVEQGFFRKHGVNVEVINIRSGPQTMAALASGDIQMAYTIPGSVLSAAAGGMDIAFFGGIVNRGDGDFVVAPSIRRGEELKGKRVGVQSIGGGVWSMRLKNVQEAESGYQALQWLYSLDIKPNLKGIQNMHRLLAMTNPKMKSVKSEDVIEESPVQRLEKTAFYKDVVAAAKK